MEVCRNIFFAKSPCGTISIYIPLSALSDHLTTPLPTPGADLYISAGVMCGIFKKILLLNNGI